MTAAPWQPSGGVTTDGILLEAKGPGYNNFIDRVKGVFYEWFKGTNTIVDQAERQVMAAQAQPIRWYVAEEKSANTIRALFQENKINVEVIFRPPVAVK